MAPPKTYYCLEGKVGKLLHATLSFFFCLLILFFSVKFAENSNISNLMVSTHKQNTWHIHAIFSTFFRSSFVRSLWTSDLYSTESWLNSSFGDVLLRRRVPMSSYCAAEEKESTLSTSHFYRGSKKQHVVFRHLISGAPGVVHISFPEVSLHLPRQLLLPRYATYAATIDKPRAFHLGPFINFLARKTNDN